jgi:hypothetical protein
MVMPKKETSYADVKELFKSDLLTSEEIHSLIRKEIKGEYRKPLIARMIGKYIAVKKREMRKQYL